MLKYTLKRIGLMLITFLVIIFLSFLLIKLLEPDPFENMPDLAEIEKKRLQLLGYDKPIIVQFFIYMKSILLHGDFGVSLKLKPMMDVTTIIKEKLPPTMLLNVYTLIFSVPVGIALGIFVALKKNKWQDHVINIIVVLFISVPAFIYAFIMQYFLAYKLDWFPLVVKPLAQANNSWFSLSMFHSLILPILALGFGNIASLCRSTRGELTEALTSDYMLLARTKGLTKGQATVRHSLKNAMVPIFPGIIGGFIGILSGSLVIERVFSIPGIGDLSIDAINALDYNVFMAITMFYTFIGLAAGILVDLSYGFLDPRIRMGAKK